MCAHIQLQEEDEDDETEAEADPVMQQLARGFIPNAGMSKLFWSTAQRSHVIASLS